MKLALARSDRILLSIVLLAALLAALLYWLLAAPSKEGAIVRTPSTFFNVPSGAKAAYQVLERLDYPVARLRRRISLETLRGVGVLVILRPQEGLARDEVAALQDWVEEGHALLVVPGDGSLAMIKSPNEKSSDLQDWFEWKPGPDKEAQPGDFPAAPPPAASSRPESDSRLTQGLYQLTAPKDRRFANSKPFLGFEGGEELGTAFWKDEWGAIGIEAASGDGTIVALADEYPFTNVGLSEADNGLLLANIVKELHDRSPGTVAFDEFHLGFVERDVTPVALAKLMFTGPWRWAAMQAALLGALAMLAQAVRFGAPQEVVRKVRRQHREFAEAAGRLFEEAGAASLAAETLNGYYRHRLCKALALEAQVENDKLCDAVARRAGNAAAERLRVAGATLRAMQAEVGGSPNRQDLLSAAQELHRVAEAVEGQYKTAPISY